MSTNLIFILKNILEDHKLSKCTQEKWIVWTVVVVWFLSCVSFFVTLWTTACQSSLSFTIFQSLLKFMSTESVMLSNHLILGRTLLLLPLIFPSIKAFSNELTLCSRWPKYQSFSISASNEYSRLVSFRIDWFDLCAVQGTLQSVLQHHNLKASIFQCSAFFMIQLTFWHDYWKNYALTIL